MALTKRKLQSMATRERIRNVALNLMRSHSIEEIGVSDICKQAGVGVGTFYHYYKTKDDIVLEVYNDMDTWFLQLAQESDAAATSAYQYALRHATTYARFVTQTTVDFARKVYAMQSGVFLDKGRPVYTTLQTFLEQKKRMGSLPAAFDIDEFCGYMMISLRGIAYDWCLHGGEYDLVQRTTWYAEHMLGGYRQELDRP